LKKELCLIDPETGKLAFKIFRVENEEIFTETQRLDSYTLILLTEATGVIRCEMSEFQIAGKEFFAFTPEQPFRLIGSVAHGYVIHFHSDFFCVRRHEREAWCKNSLPGRDRPLLKLTGEELAILEDYFRAMERELLKTEMAQTEFLISYLKILLISVSRILSKDLPESAPTDSFTDAEPLLLQSLKEAIDEHFRTRRSPSDYAILLGINKRKLSHLTKKYLRRTLTELVAERIIMEARRELFLTRKPIREIAASLGFHDEFYFSRFFKNMMDVSPSTFRRQAGFTRMEAAK